jgi:hypothetical protein
MGWFTVGNHTIAAGGTQWHVVNWPKGGAGTNNTTPFVGPIVPAAMTTNYLNWDSWGNTSANIVTSEVTVGTSAEPVGGEFALNYWYYFTTSFSSDGPDQNPTSVAYTWR